MPSGGPIVWAHRGASYELPENTLEAFALALALGADGIETDAHMTRDGVVVLSHDPSGIRMAGIDREIRDATFAEVRAWDMGACFSPRGHDARPSSATRYRIPTLAEALEALPDTVFNVDAKQTRPDMVPALVRTIRRAKAEHRVRIASFATENLQRARALGYADTGLSRSELARLVLPPLAIARRFRIGGSAAQMPPHASGLTLASQRVIDRLHVLGIRVDFWTIDDPETARRLFAMGADGIMTDDPRTVCGALRS